MMKHEVRVYADGRVCIPAGILRAFSNVAGKSELPGTIWIRKGKYGKWRLSWARLVGGQEYDLSVRERVLFGAFTKGQTFKCEHEVALGDHFLTIHTQKRPGVKRSVRTTRPPPPPQAKRSLKKDVPFGHGFDRLTRIKLGAILRDLHPEVTLAQVVEAMPTMTVGELMGTE